MSEDTHGQCEDAPCKDRWLATCAPLLETMPVAICALSADGRLCFANQQFRALTGRAAASLIGRALWELVEDSEHRQECQAQCQRILERQEESRHFTCCLSLPNGSRVFAEATWEYQLGPQQQLFGVICALSDVSSHIQAEQQLAAHKRELQEAHAELERVLATISDYVWSLRLDPAGVPFRTYFSPVVERVTGCALNEYTRAGLSQQLCIVHPNDKEKLSAWIDGLTSASGSSQLEYRVLRPDGTVRWIRDSAVCTRLEDGSLRVDGVATDVTERRLAEENRIVLEGKIQQAQKLESLGVLAGGIAHDFNNLLVGMLGNAELAMTELSPESPAREYVRNIELAAKRAADLVKQMLAYSGKGRFIVERLHLGAIVEEMLHLLQISVPKKVVLRLDVERPVPAVEADATQLRQIVMNLVTNAAEAIGDRSGVIQIGTGVMECDRAYLKETYLDDDLPEGRYSYFEVSDTGTGMREETRARIFDPFFTTKFTGRGLGLAAVLGIVRGHRGAIKIYTEPGKGTTFKVLLPAVEEATKPHQRPSATQDEDWIGDVHVLLVDDEATVRNVGKAMLEKLGCTVTLANDGQEALGVFSSAPSSFDCVLLDLTMPRLDGEQCFRELRRIAKDVRVLLSSGYSEQDLLGRFAGKGLAGFIQKPYRIGLLARKLKETLG